MSQMYNISKINRIYYNARRAVLLLVAKNHQMRFCFDLFNGVAATLTQNEQR